MDMIEALFRALDAADHDAVYRQALAIVDAAEGKGDGIERSEMIDAAFAAADWLFDEGQTLAGSRIYASILALLHRLGEDDNFEFARRLDVVAARLAAAGQPAAAREALNGAIDLTKPDAEADDQAFTSRLRRLADLEKELGNADAAETALSEAEARLGAGKSRELSVDDKVATRPFPEGGQSPQIASTPNLDEALGKVQPSDAYFPVPIYFATHRKPAAESADAIFQDPYTAYGYERSENLNFGYGIVTVPKM